MKQSVVIFCILFFAIMAKADTVVHLSSENIATGNSQLLLSEIAPDIAEYGSQVLCRAPIPGKTRTVLIHHINTLLKAEGVPVRLEAPFKEINLTRKNCSIGMELFEEAIRGELLARFPNCKFEISFKKKSLSIPNQVERVSLQSEVSLGRRNLRFELHEQDGDATSVSVTASITAVVECPVAASEIRYGTLVTTRDWNRVEVKIDSDRKLAQITDFDPTGLMISHSVREGAVLKKSWFKTPEMIRRGDRIMIVKSMGRLDILDRVEAMESGSHGEIIRVRNLKSKKIIQAKIESGNRVSAL